MPTTIQGAEKIATADFAKHAQTSGKATCVLAKTKEDGQVYFECKPANGDGLMFIRNG